MKILKDHTEIKAEMRRAGITLKDIAYWLNMSPSTITSKLSGWSPISEELLKKVNKLIKDNSRELAA